GGKTRVIVTRGEKPLTRIASADAIRPLPQGERRTIILARSGLTSASRSPRCPLQEQRLYAAGTAAHDHHPCARLAADAHFRHLDARLDQARPRRIDVADPPTQSPELVVIDIAARDRPAH